MTKETSHMGRWNPKKQKGKPDSNALLIRMQLNIVFKVVLDMTSSGLKFGRIRRPSKNRPLLDLKEAQETYFVNIQKTLIKHSSSSTSRRPLSNF